MGCSCGAEAESHQRERRSNNRSVKPRAIIPPPAQRCVTWMYNALTGNRSLSLRVPPNQPSGLVSAEARKAGGVETGGYSAYPGLTLTCPFLRPKIPTSIQAYPYDRKEHCALSHYRETRCGQPHPVCGGGISSQGCRKPVESRDRAAVP